MLSAEAAGRTPEDHIAAIKAKHEDDSAGFLIHFDQYHSTHSPENQHWSETIFQRLEAGGHIAIREIIQAFDPEKGPFPRRPIHQGHLSKVRCFGSIRR
jgi:methionyl-tRNA synthetase